MALFPVPRSILTILLGMATAAVGLAGPAMAQDSRPLFGLPLACTPGVDCWVMNYIDIGDDGDGRAVDPACGTRTYEGNKGTAFALSSRAQMDKGVAVLAAREGTIMRVRDGVDDNPAPTDADLAAVKSSQKECGNAILIDHGNGLQSLYCYLKNEIGRAHV